MANDPTAFRRDMERVKRAGEKLKQIVGQARTQALPALRVTRRKRRRR